VVALSALRIFSMSHLPRTGCFVGDIICPTMVHIKPCGHRGHQAEEAIIGQRREVGERALLQELVVDLDLKILRVGGGSVEALYVPCISHGVLRVVAPEEHLSDRFGIPQEAHACEGLAVQGLA